MQEVYNEGRVVGLSAYEYYVRHHIEDYGDDPNNPPASEREWLASTISIGSSLLLELSPDGVYTDTKLFDDDNTDSKYWGVEIKIPSNSKLCAANTIIGSLFLGEGDIDEHNPPFCKSVKDYGFLSSTPDKSNYDNMSMNPKTGNYYDNQVREYLKLIDGVVIQPYQASQQDFIPDLNDSPKIRLLFRSKIESKFYLLLCGYTNTTVVKGTSSSMDGALNTCSPVSGDFLGPAVFPWSSKIILTLPSAAISRLFLNKLQRTLATIKSTTIKYSGVYGGSYPTQVDKDPIIDYNHAHLTDFYEGNSIIADKMSRIRERVEQYSPVGDSINQFAVVSKDGGKYDPPAAFAACVDSEGYKYLYPVDCAAPGTLKAYPLDVTDEELKAFVDSRPGCYPIIMKQDGTMLRVMIDGDNISKEYVATMSSQAFYPDKSGGFANIWIGRKQDEDGNWIANTVSVPTIKDTRFIVYVDDDSDQINSDYISDEDICSSNYMDIDDSIDIPVNYISMRTVSYAFNENKRLDLLGHALKLFRNHLEKISDNELKLHIKLNVSQPMTFEESTTFEKDIDVGGDVRVGHHLVLQWHEVRGRCTEGDSTEDGYIHKLPIEAHIDIDNDVCKGALFNEQFAIGLGNRQLLPEEDSNRSITRTAGYITLPNGLRLYISKSEPIDEDIPVGSIGIGWKN